MKRYPWKHSTTSGASPLRSWERGRPNTLRKGGGCWGGCPDCDKEAGRHASLMRLVERKGHASTGDAMSACLVTLHKRRKAAEKRVVVAAMRWLGGDSHYSHLSTLMVEAARLRNVRNDITNWKRALRKKLRAMRKEQP